MEMKESVTLEKSRGNRDECQCPDDDDDDDDFTPTGPPFSSPGLHECSAYERSERRI